MLKENGKIIIIDCVPRAIRLACFLKYFGGYECNLIKMQDIYSLLYRNDFQIISKDKFMMIPLPGKFFRLFESLLKFILNSDFGLYYSLCVGLQKNL